VSIHHGTPVPQWGEEGAESKIVAMQYEDSNCFAWL